MRPRVGAICVVLSKVGVGNHVIPQQCRLVNDGCVIAAEAAVSRTNVGGLQEKFTQLDQVHRVIAVGDAADCLTWAGHVTTVVIARRAIGRSREDSVSLAAKDDCHWDEGESQEEQKGAKQNGTQQRSVKGGRIGGLARRADATATPLVTLSAAAAATAWDKGRGRRPGDCDPQSQRGRCYTWSQLQAGGERRKTKIRQRFGHCFLFRLDPPVQWWFFSQTQKYWFQLQR